jgi:hypothetical protein
MIRFATSTSYTLEQVLVEPVTMIVQIMDEWEIMDTVPLEYHGTGLKSSVSPRNAAKSVLILPIFAAFLGGTDHSRPVPEYLEYCVHDLSPPLFVLSPLK